ncbi:MAG TPA: hypothetical protein VFQ84_00670 [Arenimonas sp.]|uniref:hypothetical protein n=1 Tax=Arenimonas sp. TaxID=1872635 RepID=UPI002D7F8389|nr:hypothetical protein [Arenimonas sp.]HEU0151835.1 hypothetical protein [Arenimonas sp.]
MAFARTSAITLLLFVPALALGARWGKPEAMGLVTDRAIDEISGLAASRRHPGMFWAHNDSGGGDALHLLDGRGQRQATVATPGAENIDWEDMASFQLDGEDYLLVADTGDNGGIRQSLRLHVFEEPRDLARPATLAWTVHFRWPDGPRDCEAVAVDAVRGEVLLISKKRVPAELFRVRLAAGPDEQVAERIGTLPGIEQPDASDFRRSPTYGRYRAQITGADLSPNGRVLAVLNYRSVHFVVRGADGDWAPGLSDKLPHLALPWLPQAEAIAFSLDGRGLIVASEQLPSPIIRFQVEPEAK